jgi:predicted DCC family thiol-disulfide oxidoreductase YuxK
VADARSGASADTERWTVLYDADCGFCKWTLAWLLRWDRAARLRPLALQRPLADEFLAELTREERMASWHLISPAGVRASGGAAISPLLRLLPGGHVPAAALSRLGAGTERAYGWVAANRTALSRFVPTRSKRRAAERVCAREERVAPPA